jgi:hypothetical protein
MFDFKKNWVTCKHEMSVKVKKTVTETLNLLREIYGRMGEQHKMALVRNDIWGYFEAWRGTFLEWRVASYVTSSSIWLTKYSLNIFAVSSDTSYAVSNPWVSPGVPSAPQWIVQLNQISGSVSTTHWTCRPSDRMVTVPPGHTATTYLVEFIDQRVSIWCDSNTRSTGFVFL